MKKAFLIAVISIVTLLLVVFFSIILPKITWIKNAEEYDPYNFPGTTWICEDPDIDYRIPNDLQKGDAVAKTDVNGEVIVFFLGTNNSHVDAVRYSSDNVIKDSDLLFTGSISYSKDEFIIKIDKNSDKLFDGKYDVLVFEREDK